MLARNCGWSDPASRYKKTRRVSKSYLGRYARPAENSRKEDKKMLYEAKDGSKYRLVSSEVILRGGRIAKVYYFIGEEQPLKRFAEYADKLPDEYEIYETKTKPLVRRKHD